MTRRLSGRTRLLSLVGGVAVVTAATSAVVLSSRDGTAGGRPHSPSAASVTLPGSPGKVADAASLLGKTGPALPSAAAKAPTDAVLRFVTARIKGDAAASYALLAAVSRVRYVSVAQWQQSQGELPRPLAVTPAGPARATVGGVAVPVLVRQQAQLDVFHGYVAASETQTFLAVRTGEGWQVAAAPLASTARTPAESAVAPAASAWLARRVACDDKGSVALQASGALLGSPDLALAPCQVKGSWRAGAPQRFEVGPSTSSFLAAYGDGVAAWARVVPVIGPHGSFLAVLGPLGSTWRVTGLISDGAGS